MKKTALIFFLISLYFITFIQCKKREKGKCLGTISFTAQDLQIIPYQGGETFALIDSLGELIHYHIDFPPYKGTYHVINPDHHLNTQDDVEYEDYYIVGYVQIIDSVGYFNIYLDFTSPFKNPVEKYMTISLGISSHHEVNYFLGTSKFNNGILYSYQDALVHYDSLTLVNKKFYNVYMLSSHSSESINTTDTISRLYYNVNQGIIGLRTAKGRTWRLN